jgi:hypothetical protein
MKRSIQIFLIVLLLMISALSLAADIEVTDMPAETAPTFDDLLMTVNAPDTSPQNRKMIMGRLPKLLGWVDPTAPQYGAKGDGITDDTDAILSAANAAKITGGYDGMVLKFPAGTFNVTTLALSGVFESGKVKIQGAGMDNTKIVTTTGATVFDFSTLVSGTDIEISDLTIQGNYAGSGDGIWIKTTGATSTATVHLHGLKILNCGGRGIRVEDGYNVLIEMCDVTTCKDDAISLGEVVQAAMVRNNYVHSVYNGKYAFRVEGGSFHLDSNIGIDSCFKVPAGDCTAGWGHFGKSTSGYYAFGVLTSNAILNFSSYGVYFEQYSVADFYGNRFISLPAAANVLALNFVQVALGNAGIFGPGNTINLGAASSWNNSCPIQSYRAPLIIYGVNWGGDAEWTQYWDTTAGALENIPHIKNFKASVGSNEGIQVEDFKMGNLWGRTERTTVASPVSVDTPRWQGDEVQDTTSGRWWKSFHTDNTDWSPLSYVIASGAGTPVGAVTPDFIGQEYQDTGDADLIWKAYGLTDADWVPITSNYFSGTWANPNTHYTPTYIGQIYFNTDLAEWWMSYGLTSSSWNFLGGGVFQPDGDIYAYRTGSGDLEFRTDPEYGSGMILLNTGAVKLKSNSSDYTPALRFYENVSYGTSYIEMHAPDDVTTSVTYILPEAGTEGYCLYLEDLTGAVGTLGWVSCAGSGMADPMTTDGDMIFRDSSSATTRLPIGTEGQILVSHTDGTNIVPTWMNPASGLTLGGDDSPAGQIQYRSSGNFSANDDFYYVAASKELYIAGTYAGAKSLHLRNSSDGVASYSGINLGNDSSDERLTIRQYSSTHTSYPAWSKIINQQDAPLVLGVNALDTLKIGGTYTFMMPQDTDYHLYGYVDTSAANLMTMGYHHESGHGTVDHLRLNFDSVGLNIGTGYSAKGSFILPYSSSRPSLAIGDVSGTYFSTFKGSTQAADINYTLPPAIVTDGYLKVSSAGIMTWDNPDTTLVFQTSLEQAGNNVNLVNDVASPGNSYYYGTDAAGAKGFFVLPTVPSNIVSRAITIDSPASSTTKVIWRAPYACTLTYVRAYMVGGASDEITVNARKNGIDENLTGDLTVDAENIWFEAAGDNETDYAVGDTLEVMVETVTGTPTQLVIQVDFTQP